MSNSSQCQARENLVEFFPGYCIFFSLVQSFFYQYALTGYFFSITPLPNPSEVKWMGPYQHQWPHADIPSDGLTY